MVVVAVAEISAAAITSVQSAATVTFEEDLEVGTTGAVVVPGSSGATEVSPSALSSATASNPRRIRWHACSSRVSSGGDP